MDSDRNKVIGDRVRYYRTAKKVSLTSLAAKFSVPISQQQLAKYEGGRSRWPGDLICEVAAILRVDIRLLLGMEDGKHEGKNTDEWEAERYKFILLNLAPKARAITYRLIDGIAKFPTEKDDETK